MDAAAALPRDRRAQLLEKVRPKSSVTLDKFVCDPNKSAASVAVEAARGSFRFTTGQQNKGSYQVKTPYGTLGIRG